MAAGGMSYNGTSLLTYGVYLKKGMPRPILPPVTTRTVEVPGKDGVYSFKPNYQPRLFRLDCLLKATSRAAALAQMQLLATLLHADGVAKQLIFDDQPDRYFLAELQGDPTATLDMLSGEFSIELVCNDPFGYGIAEIDNVYTISTDPQQFIENPGGTCFVEPVYIIIPSVAWSGTLTLGNIETDQQLAWTGALTTSQLLEIDVKRQVVKVNSSPSMSGFGVSSVFPKLLSAVDNHIEVGGILGSLEVTYRARYL